MLKPLQYKDVLIYNSNDKLIFTGTFLNNRFTSTKDRHLVVISGYSKSGILEDVTIPVSQYPLESNGKSFIEIARRLAGIFKINVVVSDQAKSISQTKVVGKRQDDIQEQSEFESVKAKSKVVFGRTSAEPTETIKNYLAKLAGQKNLIMSHNEKGEVLIFQPSYNQKPKYFFDKTNTVSMEADFNGQALHSEINVVRQPSDENEGATTADKAINNLIPLYRPTTKILTSGEDLDTENSAKNELANELKAITVKLSLEGLFDGIYTGEIVNVHNHYIYCYAYNRFMVDEIIYKFDETSETTDLILVVPETFNGGFIRNILFNHLVADHHFEPRTKKPAFIQTTKF